MTSASLLECLGRGDWSALDSEWLNVFASEEVPEDHVEQCREVLAKLVERGQTEKAAEYATTALEAMLANAVPRDVLTFANEFLLVVGNDAAALRKQIANVYRKAYSDADQLEPLLDEAGIEEGRPVRRALRTLNVCLNVTAGDYLVARHEHGVARIDEIELPEWNFTVTEPDGSERYGPVHLADEYEPARAGDYRVLAHFDRPAMEEKIAKDPAWLLAAVCSVHGGTIDSDRLEAELVPHIMEAKAYKKWWTAARAAIRKSRNFRLTGRSPYTVEYDEAPPTPEDEFENRFAKGRSAKGRLDVVNEYVKECKAVGHEPSQEALDKFASTLLATARAAGTAGTVEACEKWMVACRSAEIAGSNEARGEALTWLQSVESLLEARNQLDDASLVELFCDLVSEAHPEDWQKRLAELLPTLPASVCDKVAARLVEQGWGRDRFASIVQQITADPVTCFEAMSWLWDGPTHEAAISDLTLASMFSRLLVGLDEARKDASVSKERAKQKATRARAALSARNYERFRRLVDGIDVAMSRALRTQIRRLDNLGKAVPEDLERILNERFALTEAKARVEPWKRDDVIFVTDAGMRKRQEEIDHHVNVKMRENAKAIGAAAEHGDLSENSEYKFALEERDLLRGQLAHMNEEMQQAQVLSPDDVPTDHVGVGTHIQLKRTTDGMLYDLCFVGPWDASADKHLFNYKAPVAERLMGKKVGDKIQLEFPDATGEFEIAALSNYLAHDED